MRPNHILSPRKSHTREQSVQVGPITTGTYSAKLAAALKMLEESGLPRRQWPVALGIAGYRDVPKYPAS